MSATPRDLVTDASIDEAQQRVAARAPLGFAIFYACLALSVVFEILRFPERAVLMGAFAIGFAALAAICWLIVDRRPAHAIGVLIGFVNLAGIGVNGYHVLAGASLAMCIWQLVGLLCVAALLLPWGGRNQMLACVGTMLSYPLHLEAPQPDPLAWAAGGAYLLVVVALSAYGSSLLTRYVEKGVRLKAALTEREARLQSWFDLSLVGCAILSRDLACREVNDELCRMLGVARDDLLGRPFPDAIHREERPTCAEALARSLSAGSAPEQLEIRLARAADDPIHALVSVRGLPGPRGGNDQVMVLVQDITERKRLELERERHIVRVEAERESAEAESRAKDEFLATVSHELKTPLTPILGWSTLLRRGGLSAERTSAAIDAIERNARSQAQLIDDLLDVSRIVMGKWRLELATIEVAPVVQAAADVLVPSAEAKGVNLRVALPARRLLVRGDAARLQQVVWNLVSNAVKFTPSGGRVRVTLAEDAGVARITVEDTGEGVVPEALPHIFERFRQADGSTSRRHGGLGLGLAIVRVLVEMHGGTVRAESPGAGRGSAFTVELPLADAASDVPHARPVMDFVRGATLRGLRVLVVDDDRDSTMLMSALFASCGADVRIAHSAREAVAIAEAWPPHVLVTDLAMPEEDGYALLRELRHRGGRLGAVPAVAVTAYAGTEERLSAAGFDTQILKPFDPAELAATVERLAMGGGWRPDA